MKQTHVLRLSPHNGSNESKISTGKMNDVFRQFDNLFPSLAAYCSLKSRISGRPADVRGFRSGLGRLCNVKDGFEMG